MQSIVTLYFILMAVSSASTQHAVHYVKPNDWFLNCYNQTCLTLDQYTVQAKTYFTTGSTFILLAGDHNLQTTVNITSISDITFRRDSDINITNIICKNEVTILCENATNVTFEGLTFTLHSTNIHKGSSVLEFFNSRDILISNSRFQGSGNVTGHLIRAISSVYSTLRVVSCHFEGNTGDFGGAISAMAGSSIYLTGNYFIRNKAKYSGGAIFTKESSITLKETLGNVFVNNSGRDSGGALSCKKSNIDIIGDRAETSSPSQGINTTLLTSPAHYFFNNNAEYGGAIYLLDTLASFDGTAIVFKDNLAAKGGGIFMYSSGYGVYGVSGRTILTTDINLYFTGNKASKVGGAIYSIRSYLTLRDTANSSHYFENNSAGEGGGAIYSDEDGRVTIMGASNFTNNRALSASGGAILILLGNFLVTGKAIFTNNEGESGGVIALFNSHASLNGTEIEFAFNSANTGGGIFAINSQLVTNTKRLSFIGNIAQNRGGGIAVLNSDRITSISGIFIDNRGECGGALFIQRGENVVYNSISLTGNLGSAICATDSSMTFNGPTRITNNADGGFRSINSVTLFKSYTVFENNSALTGGALNLLYGTTSFSGVTLLKHNTAEINGGALYAVGTSVVFKNVVNITSNVAQNGGAIYLTSVASLTLAEHTTLTTSNNHASQYGGAVYHEDTALSIQCNFESGKRRGDISLLPHCFLVTEGITSYSMLPVSINSNNDSANMDGSYLYGGMLDRCQISVRNNKEQFQSILPYILYTKYVLHMESLQDNNTTKTIISQPYQLCFCETTQKYDCSQSQTREVYKGQKFALSLLAVAQGGIATSTLVTAKTSLTARLKLNQSSQYLPQECTDLNYSIYSTENQEELTLYPDGPCRDTGLARAIIKVTLLPCPPGFVQSPSGEECVCEKKLQENGAKCSIDEDANTIVRVNGSTFWMSALYENDTYQGLVFTKKCPFNYCKTETIVLSLYNSDVQCDLNRSGVLCGSCAANYSLLLGSTTQCLICPNTYLALLLPFAAAGIALVVFLSLLRLTVATGMINSVIFYANIVQVNRKLFLPNNTVNVLTVFIAWLNLDLGIETCFYDGMDAYAKTWLQFAFPIYIWILISMIILTSRYSLFVSKLIGHNPIAVLATLLLMSYTKILNIIIQVFSFSNLEYPDKTIPVWLYDANMPYLRSKHLLLIAVIFLVFIFLCLPYTFLLLLGYKLYRFSDRRYLRWLNRTKPLLDSYYAPYKTHTCYWTGFLLIVRCALYVVFLFDSLVATNVALTLSLTGILIKAWLLGRIYEKLTTDIIESSIYLNLTIISVTTLAGLNSSGLVYSLVGITFVTMIYIIVYHIRILYTAKIAQSLRKLIMKTSTDDNTPVVSKTSRSSPKKIVSKTFIELREPLLEIDS